MKRKLQLKRTILIIIFLVIMLCVRFGIRSYNLYKSFSLLGDKEIVMEYGANYNEPGYSAKYKLMDISDYVNIDSKVDFEKLGEYKINYNLDYQPLKLKKTLTRNVKIIDITPPVITSKDDKVYIYKGEKFSYNSFKVEDNYDGDITENAVIESTVNTNVVGNYVFIIKAFDQSGNYNEKRIDVVVKEKPNITYIDINITKQKLNYYYKNDIILTSDIVTGINGKTPTGNYKVLGKYRNVKLVGADYVSFVSYWIPFIGGSFGIHDATWRSSFGGTIYKTNGSHGCINVPTSTAKKLYEIVPVGTTIKIHY